MNGDKLYVQGMFNAPLDRPFTLVDDALAGQAGSMVIEMTDVDRALIAGAQLDGARKTARFIAHALNNKLTYLTGYGSLVRSLVSADTVELVDEIVHGAMEAAEVIAELQILVRFEETTAMGTEPMIDLVASTRIAADSVAQD